MLLLMKPHVSLPFGDDSTAYSIGLSTNVNVIDQKRNIIKLQPGLHTIISVTPQYIETSEGFNKLPIFCLLYTSPSPRDRTRSRMPSSA